MSDQKGSRASHRRVLLAGLCLLGVVTPAHAYMDPGSASIIVTSILGALAAVGYTWRLYWRRFKDLLARAFVAVKQGKQRVLARIFPAHGPDKQHPGGE
jgi:hypothetical protein